jgi:hypothetical protein
MFILHQYLMSYGTFPEGDPGADPGARNEFLTKRLFARGYGSKEIHAVAATSLYSN